MSAPLEETVLSRVMAISTAASPVPCADYPKTCMTESELYCIAFTKIVPNKVSPIIPATCYTLLLFNIS
jgi:hypothetical protein